MAKINQEKAGHVHVDLVLDTSKAIEQIEELAAMVEKRINEALSKGLDLTDKIKVIADGVVVERNQRKADPTKRIYDSKIHICACCKYHNAGYCSHLEAPITDFVTGFTVCINDGKCPLYEEITEGAE